MTVCATLNFFRRLNPREHVFHNSTALKSNFLGSDIEFTIRLIYRPIHIACGLNITNLNSSDTGIFDCSLRARTWSLLTLGCGAQTPGGPADVQGCPFKPGDVVAAIDGRNVRRISTMQVV